MEQPMYLKMSPNQISFHTHRVNNAISKLQFLALNVS